MLLIGTYDVKPDIAFITSRETILREDMPQEMND